MPQVEVTIPVPEERLADFYSVVGAWLSGEERTGTQGRQRPQHRGTVSRRSRYAPLYTYLTEQVSDTDAQVELPFSEVEKIIDAKLPQSAYQHRAWWANTPSHAQANAWVSAGWRVDRVDFEGDTVTLTRTDGD
jgi:hypothetical protein